MRTLRVRVLDAEGKPAPMATVEARGNGTIKHPEGLTGIDGWTGADPLTDGMVVTVKQYTATDTPEAPAVTEDFRYEITAMPGGKSASRSVFGQGLGTAHHHDSQMKLSAKSKHRRNNMRTKLVTLTFALLAAGTSVMGALTPEGVQKDLDAVTTISCSTKPGDWSAPKRLSPSRRSRTCPRSNTPT